MWDVSVLTIRLTACLQKAQILMLTKPSLLLTFGYYYISHNPELGVGWKEYPGVSHAKAGLRVRSKVSLISF